MTANDLAEWMVQYRNPGRDWQDALPEPVVEHRAAEVLDSCVAASPTFDRGVQVEWRVVRRGLTSEQEAALREQHAECITGQPTFATQENDSASRLRIVRQANQ